MKRRDQLKAITQLYKFDGGEEIFIIVRYVPGQSREEAVQALVRVAKEQAEMTWARMHVDSIDQSPPPGSLVGEVLDISGNGKILKVPWRPN